MVSEEQKQKWLLEERYAAVRTEVRDAYEKCMIAARMLQYNSNEIKKLEDKRNMFTAKKIDKSIDEILSSNQDLDITISELRECLSKLSAEMEDLEKKLGLRAECLYGRDPGWWIRK